MKNKLDVSSRMNCLQGKAIVKKSHFRCTRFVILTVLFQLGCTMFMEAAVCKVYLDGVNSMVSGFQTPVTGSVSDAEGPLPGATVMVKGTSNGTTTDFDGNYEISVPNGDAVLIVSYIGYASKEIVVGSSTTINIMLEADMSQLDEVVVLGYTTKKRGEVTGSVSTINNEELENTSNKDLAKSILKLKK